MGLVIYISIHGPDNHLEDIGTPSIDRNLNLRMAELSPINYLDFEYSLI